MDEPETDVLQGKVAIVTGGGSGIGAALVDKLTAAGASVMAVDRDTQALETIAAATGCATRVVDVADRRQNEELVAQTLATFGRLDLAFLNAGVLGRSMHELGQPYRAADIDLDRYDLVMAVNTDGVVYGTIAAAKAMAEGDGGAIIATASTAGLMSWTPTPMYAASKHAVVGWMRALAPALEADGVTLNAICPAGVATPLVGRTSADAQDEKRLLAPTTVADAMIATALGGGTGQAVTVVAGRDPISMPHAFAPIPGFP